MILCDDLSKIMKENEKVFNTWFEVWLLVHVPKLMKQSKWFESDSVNVGDIILFTKHEYLTVANVPQILNLNYKIYPSEKI